MVNTPLDIKYVFKRERYLEKKKTISESATIPDLENVRGRNIYNQKVESFVSECSSYEDALSILEMLYNDNRFDLLETCVQKVINNIIPLTENSELNSCMDAVKQSNIGDINKDRLCEAVSNYKAVDRIIKNHNNLTKRFEMDTLKGKSNRDKAFSVCEMVGTYTLDNFAKFNIVMEELAYLGQMNGDRMPDEEMVQNVSEYFLMINENTAEDISNYRKAISKSRIIANGADQNVGYLMNGATGCGWRRQINEWLLDPCKDINGIVNIIKENYGDITILNRLIDFVNEYTKINDMEIDPIVIFSEMGSLGADEAHNVSKLIKENDISNTDELLSSLNAIWEAEKNDAVYADGTTEPETFTSDEIDKFKMHNLIVDSQAVGEFLDHLEKTSMRESCITRNKLSRHDVINEDNLINDIDANGFITTKIRSYTIAEDAIDEAVELIENAVRCINNGFYGRDSHCYYTICDENNIDVSIRSKYQVQLSGSEAKMKGFSESDLYTIAMIKTYCNNMEAIAENTNLFNIAEKMISDKDYAATVSVEEASLINDLISHLSAEDGLIDEFVQSCIDEANPDAGKIKLVCSESTDIGSSEYDTYRIKLCAEAMGVDEDDDDDKKDDEKDKDSDKESKPENIKVDKKADKAIKSLNDVKLVWKGVKGKMKNASAKEQEISRDMDVEFNHMLKTMKSALVPDHREEIITGEVNHSLSKAIKMAIALAGVGLAAHTAIVPIIMAVGIFARSKYTTLKEKNMILDEIDTELKVLDREINRAEQSGSSKKYRQLLSIQKNLMRKRQEIYYSLAKKGKRIPMQATEGLRDRE